MSATVTDPTDDVKAMSPERRKCLLEPEISTSLYQVHHHSPFLFAELSSYPISRQSSFQNIPNLAASWRTTSRLYWTSLSMVDTAVRHFFISIILRCLPYFLPKVPDYVIKKYVPGYKKGDPIVCR